MKIKYILSMIAIVAVTKNSFAQYSQDALRFSTTQTGSTARVKAIGNANVALGGDLTSVSGNPAGLGFFTKSEFSVTPEYDMFKDKASFFGTTTNDKKNTGNLSNAAIVFYSRLNTPRGTDKTKGWLSVNFGLGYSRTNDFYENTTYNGTNPTGSIADYYASLNDANMDDPLASTAYAQYLIYDPDATHPNSRRSALPGVSQTGVITRTGGQSEFNLAVGGNYSNKLYIGGSLGIATIRYNSTTNFIESGTLSLNEDTSDPVTRESFRSVYSQDQVTRGTGINLKLGLIYKPVEALRLGFNFTSPTWYDMQDTYSENINTKLTNDNLTGEPSTYPLNYVLRTPLKVAGGLAVFIKQYGFITGDVEYVDYSSANLSQNEDDGGGYDPTTDNRNISTLYKGAVNARIGAEARLSSFAYLRGGYNVQGNPMKENGSSVKTATGGIGFRSGSYSVDATYAHVTGSQTIFPYEVGAASPSADLKRSNDNVYLTLSYRF